MLIDISSGARQPGDGRRDSIPVPSITAWAELQDAKVSAELSEYVVREKSSGRALFRFSAHEALPIDSDTILVRVAGSQPGTSLNPGDEVSIYLVTVSTQTVTYIATQTFCRLVSGTSDYVAWTEGYGPDDGKVRIYDRHTGEIKRLDVAFGPQFAANGMLGDGPGSNLRVLVDLKEFQYYAILPRDGRGYFNNWSPDFRFASSGDTVSFANTC